MSSLKGKRWADLAYSSESEDELKSSQSQSLIQSTVSTPILTKSQTSISDELPRYYQRVLSSVESHSGTLVELVIRDCPKGVTEKELRDYLPIIEAIITPDYVTIFMKKEDVIQHIKTKRLSQMIQQKLCSLSVQRASEELRKIEEKYFKVQSQTVKEQPKGRKFKNDLEVYRMKAKGGQSRKEDD